MNTNLTEARPRGYPLEVHIDTELPSLSSPVSIVTVCLNVGVDHTALGAQERTLGTSSLPGSLGTTESERERLRHITHSVYTGHTACTDTNETCLSKWLKIHF